MEEKKNIGVQQGGTEAHETFERVNNINTEKGEYYFFSKIYPSADKPGERSSKIISNFSILDCVTLVEIIFDHYMPPELQLLFADKINRKLLKRLAETNPELVDKITIMGMKGGDKKPNAPAPEAKQ